MKSSTNNAFNASWKIYVKWCREKKYNPEALNPQQVVDFLVNNNKKRYSTLNGYRSAIASILTITYPNHKPIADTRDVIHFFKSKRRI